MRVLSWNLFHGRDHPPDPTLFTWRSRLLRTPEANATHVQVNRPLRLEFSAVLARDPWDVALLQEAPPRWLGDLCRGTGSAGASTLTSRNLGAAARAWLAERNPDLAASNEGGSNQLLVRPPWRIAETRHLTLTLRPERRRMLWALVEAPDGRTLAVANLHATASDRAAAERDVVRAAESASEWAGSRALVFGGDLNLRPARSARAFEVLRERFGLAPPTAPDAIDHLLCRGIDLDASPRRLPPEWREVAATRHDAAGRDVCVRLSDHAPVVAVLRESRR